MTPNRKLTDTIRSIPAASLQNALMRISDRDLAISMLYMEDPDRMKIFMAVSKQKEIRVKEELTLNNKRKVTYKHYTLSVQAVISSLINSRTPGKTNSYLRPRRPNNR
jgi:hypothetical protein